MPRNPFVTPTKRGSARKVFSSRKRYDAGPTYRQRMKAAYQAAVASSKKSPAYTKKSGVRKSLSRAGASSSKSSGKFKKATGRKTTLDYFVKNGIVEAVERGGIFAAGAGELVQSIAVGHSTIGPVQVRRAVAYGLCKMVAQKLNRDLVVFSDVVSSVTSRAERLLLMYTCGSTGNSTLTINIGITTTWTDMKTAFLALFNSLVDDPSFRMLSMEYFHVNVATTPAVGQEIIFKLDLLRARVKLYVKSALKIQNRTINSSGNDEEADVDNVPLYGKQYDGKGNYVSWNQGNNFASTSYLIADENNLLGQKCTPTISSGLCEPPPLSILKNASKIGKAHLEPGHIKTSVLTYSASHCMNTLLQKLVVWQLVGNNTTVAIGQFRLFIMEKMIQAIGTDTINAPKIAYELDSKTGVICTAPKMKVTSLIINQTPL